MSCLSRWLGLIVVLSVMASPAAGEPILGDVNNDGAVDVSDALVVVSFRLDPSAPIPNDGDITLGDVNGDGRIKVVDALMIATYAIDSGNASLPSGIGMPVETSEVGEKELLVTLPGGATMAFVWIEPGTFTMGITDEQELDWVDERVGSWASEEYWKIFEEFPSPAHEVTITRGFYMGKYELTQGQWESVMGTKPWYNPRGKLMRDIQEHPDNPAVYISWEDVQEFIAKLNEAEEAEAYRLPTEAEWEYACRAGTSTIWSFEYDYEERQSPDNPIYDHIWYVQTALKDKWGNEVGEEYAHAVGTKLPNPWGLYDMYGNVEEYVQDWFGRYPSSPQVDPTGPATESEAWTGDFPLKSDPQRVKRGGGYVDGSVDAISSARRAAFPWEATSSAQGARLVRQGP